MHDIFMRVPMLNPDKITEAEPDMNVMDAIYGRHSVRSYTPRKIDKAVIQKLLEAAAHAPSAMDEEAWAFAVIQDAGILKKLSEKGKELLGQELKSHPASHALGHLTHPDFNLFYNAGTLIVIYGKPLGSFIDADCWLAAENLILASCAAGLATCVIGSAVSALNTPEWKTHLNIPPEMTAIAPIILGEPSGEVKAVTRKATEILFWN